MHASAKSRPGRRTRLSPQREAEVYEAVLQLLREVGYESMTIQAITDRARCSTATLYRQWQGKPGLVVAALQHAQPSPPTEDLEVDTGSLRGDLREVVRRVHDSAPAALELAVGLALAVTRDPELASTVRARLSAPAGEALDRILQRAADRGEISPDTPARAYAHLMLLSISLGPVLEMRHTDMDYQLCFLDAVLLPALRLPARPEP